MTNDPGPLIWEMRSEYSISQWRFKYTNPDLSFLKSGSILNFITPDKNHEYHMYIHVEGMPLIRLVPNSDHPVPPQRFWSVHITSYVVKLYSM